MTNPVPTIFKNEQHQKDFDEQGFVKVELLSQEDVKQLNELFLQYYPDPSSDFYSSSYENDFTLKKKISDEIGKVIVKNLDHVFENYTWFGSAFLSKGNGPRSEMPMHQDWTIVDEKKYVAINIWTPLQDTNEENGTLEVIKGSHRWHDSLRAPTLPFYYDGHQSQLKEILHPINTKATEAVVLNQAIIHYSKPNKTNDIRIAITTGIKTKGSPMLFHYWDKNSPCEIELFEQEEDFLINFENFHQSIFQRPVIGKSLGKKPYSVSKPTSEELAKYTLNSLEDKITTRKKVSIQEKLFGWLKA